MQMIDSVDYLAAKEIPIPRHEWKIMRVVGVARKTKQVPRLCMPACPSFKRDIDGGSLCSVACTDWILDTHRVERGEKVFELLYATDPDDPHHGFCWQVGENYLRSLLGDAKVERMLGWCNSLHSQPEEGYVIKEETYEPS